MDHRRLAAALVLVLAATAARADEPCKIMRAAALDISMDPAGGLNISAVVDGHDVKLLVDTGAPFSLMSEESAAALGIRAVWRDSAAGYLFGGVRLNRQVTAKTFALGRLSTTRMDFILLPPKRLPKGVDGTLGSDILGAYDIDIDIAQKKLSLMHHSDCGEGVIYWTNAAWGEADLLANQNNHLALNAKLDGKEMRILLDTGSSISVMDLKTAKELFGLDNVVEPDRPGLIPHRFTSLEFDSLSVANPEILLDPNRNFGVGYNPEEGPLIVGMDVLRHLHLYIAYRQRKLYFTAADAR